MKLKDKNREISVEVYDIVAMFIVLLLPLPGTLYNKKNQEMKWAMPVIWSMRAIVYAAILYYMFSYFLNAHK